jgi:predicted regulator of Ras-like GTPase activity (Roadblock/LC7/MglB family)
VEDLLRDIQDVAGVLGACVCDADGEVVATTLPKAYDPTMISGVGKTFNKTFEALRVARRRKITEMDLTFETGRLVVKNLAEGCMIIVCIPAINVPLLNLTANVVARKAQDRLKLRLVEAVEKERAAEAPAVGQPPEPAPAEAAPAPTVAAVEEPAAAPVAEPVKPAGGVADEARLIVTTGRDRKLMLRVMGEVGIRMRCPVAETLLPPPPEVEQILEMACRSNQARQIEAVLEGLGYVPNKRFNMLYGSERQRFAHPDTKLFVEVFFDRLVSYHTLDFSERLHMEEFTLPLADLLSAELLNVEAGERTFRRIFAVLHDHDLGGPGQFELVDATAVVALCAEDWGWYKTVSMNLEKCIEAASTFYQGPDLETFDHRAGRLRQMIEEAPKSLRWQMRARIGESRRWYEVPE